MQKKDGINKIKKKYRSKFRKKIRKKSGKIIWKKIRKIIWKKLGKESGKKISKKKIKMEVKTFRFISNFTGPCCAFMRRLKKKSFWFRFVRLSFWISIVERSTLKSCHGEISVRPSLLAALLASVFPKAKGRKNVFKATDVQHS